MSFEKCVRIYTTVTNKQFTKSLLAVVFNENQKKNENKIKRQGKKRKKEENRGK
jgi:hypothetical protein